MWTIADVTFGGGTKAERLTVSAMRAEQRAETVSVDDFVALARALS